MSAAACKAAICDDKAEKTSLTLANLPDYLLDEKPETRIKVSEYIIKCNEATLKGVLEIIDQS